MTRKRALITGITGQDGAYLADFLIRKGYEVYGTFRRLSTPNFWRLQYLKIESKIKLIPMDLLDTSSISEAFSISDPEEIYHLAAQSFVGASFEQPLSTANMTGLGTTRMLEVMRRSAKDAKFYQASTSELFGNNFDKIKDENSPFMPRSPYAIAKLYAYWTARTYREAYSMFICNGILFNHESPLRGLEFVTRKITNAVARIALGLQKSMSIGNIYAKRDWGYAPDYVESMWKMLNQEAPDDYVIATGKSHSVEELLTEAFQKFSLNYTDHVIVDKGLIRPLEVDDLCGNPTKAEKKLDWLPSVTFSDLVGKMTQEDLNRWKMYLAEKSFPWDAPLYPEDLNIIISRYQLDR